ncbi:MAG TPA: hypothetical protein VG147_11705 [Solirubrobacteraceae bacterium]|nr:hypothetical protein [Solirubrobacteraceae bacterium]
MAERLFLFVQMEFPWELGPADGRYLLRVGADAEPERVVILETVGATPRRGRLGARRRPPVEPEPEPTTVPSTRATVIDPVSVSAEHQARAWLAQLDAEREARLAAVTINRLLFAHRIATADPHVRELSPTQALTTRAGWGEGEQVAYGQWAHARELRFSERRTRRSAALRPQERFAALLGAREAALLCEELTLRAHLDLDQGRLAHAAIELEQAYTAALLELPAEDRLDLAPRIAELEQLRPAVSAAARAAPATPDEQALRHALTRLEAALRARTAGGLGRG